MSSPSTTAIPITVFTGFLGAGKTTCILSLLPQLPKDYKVVLLKNEFGDVEVDSQLAKQSSLIGVSEILNGCMCCILVGQMKTALLEIRDKYRPDRIIIETSGSAFPATLAIQIRDLEKETDGDFKLDAILTVVDAENFMGYEDTSVTAKMQAIYTDLIIINKWENVIDFRLWHGKADADGSFTIKVSERQLDMVMDHLFTLNESTPKLRAQGRRGVPPSLVFGLDSKLYLGGANEKELEIEGNHHDEVETVTISRGRTRQNSNHSHEHDHEHSLNNIALNDDRSPPIPLTPSLLDTALASAPKDFIYRIKGYVTFSDGRRVILNWAFGRYDLTELGADKNDRDNGDLRLSVMGENGEVRRWASRWALENFGITI